MAIPTRFASLLPLLSLLAVACGTEVPVTGEPVDPVGEHAAALAPAAASPVKATAAGVRLHTELVTGVRFPVPTAGVTVEERHFDPSVPEYKFKHSIRLKSDGGRRVLIDVWNNPQGLALNAWFTEHLGFLGGWCFC